jgi:hypothetical protein
MLTAFPETVEIFPQASPGEIDIPISTTQPGRVKALGSFWFAEFYNPHCYTDLTAGTPVKVVGRKGIALLVVPEDYTLPDTCLRNAARKQKKWFSGLAQTISSASVSCMTLMNRISFSDHHFV